MTSQGGVMLMFRILIVEKIRWLNRKVLQVENPSEKMLGNASIGKKK